MVIGANLTPDGRRAVSASDDKTLRVWDWNRVSQADLSEIRGKRSH